MIEPREVALGVLAGGRGERVGGRDKAWLPHQGRPALESLLADLHLPTFGERLASVRGPDPRWGERGFTSVADLRPGQPGPLAGIEALASASRCPWLFLLPVDLRGAPRDLYARLAAAAGTTGAWLRDAGGLQPLVGLWRTVPLRQAAAAALAAGEGAAHRALASLQPATVDISPRRLGNANTPADYDLPP